MARTLRLKFQSYAFREGRVPLTVLAEKLHALQNLVFHAAATVTEDGLGRSGPWANRYRDIAELAFVTSHHSDLVIEAELPEPRDGFLPGAEDDRGAKALALVFDAGRAATAGGGLASVIRSRDDRLRLLRAFELLCPAAQEGYRIELANGGGPADSLLLSAETRQTLNRQAARERTMAYGGEEEETIVGQLTKIHVHTRPQLIAVRAEHQEIRCYFDDTMLDQISNLVPGSFVEVTGWPVTDTSGRKQIDSITDVDPVSMEPLRFARIEHEGKRYVLREPLLVEVEYSDSVWVYRNDSINLWGYAKRRADALKHLAATFDYLFREIAQEEDESLDGKALALKQRLLALVETEEEARGG
jgi:hypothetical protein